VGQVRRNSFIRGEKTMKKVITEKSELRWPQLVRDYTFDIQTDEGETILTSQSLVEAPANIRSRLAQIATEYQAAYEEANDVEVGEEV